MLKTKHAHQPRAKRTTKSHKAHPHKQHKQPFSGAAKGGKKEKTAPADANINPDDKHEFVPVKPHFNYRWIQQNADVLKESMQQRNYSSVDVDEVCSLIDKRHNLNRQAQQYRAYRKNIASATSAAAAKQPFPEITKIHDPIFDMLDLSALDMKALVAEGKRVKADMASTEAEFEEVDEKLSKMAFKLPNITHPSAPIGGEENATCLDHPNKDMGSLAAYQKKGFVPRDHLDLCRENGWVDFEAAADVTGRRFYYLKGSAALLEMALINFGLSKLIKRGYTPVLPPDLARLSVIEGAGFQSKDEKSLEAQVYRVEGSDLTLSGTAEIPLAGLYMNQILSEEQLPIKMVAYNHCFRPEVGGYGTNSRGLYRVHQFSKVEMFVIGTPDQSDALHQELIDIECEIFKDLGLNFKVLDMPTGDLGAPAYRKIDMEAAMPGRAITIHNAAQPGSTASQSAETLGEIKESFGEISSTSNCTDYQARRLGIRYKPNQTANNDVFVPPALLDEEGLGEGRKEGTTRFVHTLNGTACAIPRLIVSIIEQHQEPGGKVRIPQALQPFMLGGPQEYM